MMWKKMGLVFKPDGRYSWMLTHATAPVVLDLGEGYYRIYFSSRNKSNCSHIGYVEINIRNPFDILNVSEQPVLSPGPLGYFDDHGVFTGSLIKYNGAHYLYYLGWNPGARSPLFYSAVGIAISHDGGLTFKKQSKVPILDRSEHDPWTVLLPCIIREGDCFRMWYGSGFRWEEHNGQLESFYHIKYAESRDGLHWNREGRICIDLKPGESNVAHPYVLHDNGIYKMWYSYNFTSGYRIGYAESNDGYEWIRKDEEVGISLSEKGWDSESISHPYIIVYDHKKYMLYNGNDFGRNGFGIGVATDEI